MKSLYDFYELYLAGKAKSRVYSLFLGWLTIFHLPIIFSAVFVDQQLIYQKYNLLKGEYISEKFLDFDSISFWAYELISVLLAVLITWLTIWILPKSLFKIAYNREIEDEYSRKLAKLTKENELENARKNLAETQYEVVEKEIEVIKKQEEVETEERKNWNREYASFKKTEHFKTMYTLMKAVYEEGGDLRLKSGSGYPTRNLMLPTKSLAYFDTKGIVTIPEFGKIELTQKGKYFLDRFQN